MGIETNISLTERSEMLLKTAKFGSSLPFVASIRNRAKGVIVNNPSADFLPYKGIVADRKSVKVSLEAGKSYAWCSCGHSNKQPFCDGSHKLNGITNVRPVSFQVEKDGEYRLCNCKQTNSRPICDSSHKKIDPAPKDLQATRFVAFGNSPVYDGVAHKLGYKPKNNGFQ